jgi:D-sedoheptulose 7-phosphate isomerase
MTFPDNKYGDIGSFWTDYAKQLQSAAASVDPGALAQAARVLAEAYRNGTSVYVCGNGGSASISNHLVCDHLKGAQTDTALRPRVISLAANLETITALANDIGYEVVFAYQLKTLAKAGDVLITISSSGDSPNVVAAAQWAKANGVKVIAMSGFSGGRTRTLADVSLHVTGDNYGVIEDVHQSLMHTLAQYLRQAEMSEKLIHERKF